MAVTFSGATTSPVAALALFGAGACLVAALLALVMRQSLAPGRAGAMWSVLADGLRRRGGAA